MKGVFDISNVWFQTLDALFAQAKSTCRMQYKDMSYVMLRPKPAGWTVDQTKDKHERHMYQLPLTGPAFEHDSALV